MNPIDHHHDSSNRLSSSCNATGSSSLEKDMEPSCAKARPRVTVSEDQALLWKTIQLCILSYQSWALKPKFLQRSRLQTHHIETQHHHFQEVPKKQNILNQNSFFLISVFGKIKKMRVRVFSPECWVFSPVCWVFSPELILQKNAKKQKVFNLHLRETWKATPRKSISPFSIPSRPRAIPATKG